MTEPLAPEDWTTKMTLLRALATGAAAGAAGTTALNATTYVDMAVRGRPSSSTPEATVEKGADTIGVTVPGDENTRSNRLQGLGPLSGIVTGVGVGAFAGALRAARLPGPAFAVRSPDVQGPRESLSGLRYRSCCSDVAGSLCRRSNHRDLSFA